MSSSRRASKAQANGAHRPNNNMRIPTVQEALPYSPFTSIIPFDPALIVSPSVSTESSTSLLSLLPQHEQTTATRLLTALDHEAVNAEKASNQLKQTLLDVQKLLTHDQLPHIKFKPLHAISTQTAPDQNATRPRSAMNGQKAHLDPFAQLAFDASMSSTKYTHADRVPAVQVNPTFVPLTKQPEISHVIPVTHKTPTSSQQATDGPSIIITKTLTPQERSQYIDASSFASPARSAKKTAMISPTISGHVTEAQALHDLESLQTLLIELDEADSNCDPSYFAQIEDMSNPPLQSQIQSRLDKLVAAAITNKVIGKLTDAHLLSIVTLSTRSMVAIQPTTLTISQSYDDEAVQEWSANITDAERALQAARTILRIIKANTDNKQLWSEEMLTTLTATLVHISSQCIIPVTALRSDSAEAFAVARSSKSLLNGVFATFTKTLNLLGTFLLTNDVDGMLVTTVTSLCTTLIFVENASSEKDSALGVQAFEKPRKTSMDVLAKVFSRHENQRKSIFADILTSLEHLPVTRQSARQFRLPDAKPMQLVSALLMRLVQSSATQSTVTATIAHREVSDGEKDDSQASSDESDSSTPEKRRPTKASVHSSTKASTPEYDRADLKTIVKPLLDACNWDTSYAVHYLVDRALTSSKSSDEPYRNLLDIFVEDFLNVLGHPDWPSAELFLRHLTGKLYDIAEGKHSAPAKSMALELLGVMISGIIDLQMTTTSLVNTSTWQEHRHNVDLGGLHKSICADEQIDKVLLAIDGPYAVLCAHLNSRTAKETHVTTAADFQTVQWAERLLSSKDGSFDASHGALATLKKSLASALTHDKDATIDTDASDSSLETARVCAALVTLRSPFCTRFNPIFSKLLSSMSSDQPSLRSKALKSVDQVLEKDPALLDRGTLVVANIVKCLSDPSSQVKESALGLLSKCMIMRRGLESLTYVQIANLAQDASIGVKKRAMRLLKDLYLRNEDPNIRSVVSGALLLRINDDEDTVKDLARLTLEEIWFTPLHALDSSNASDALQSKLLLQQQSSMLIGTIQQSESIAPILQDLLIQMMSKHSKAHVENTRIAKDLVLAMVDAIISEDALPGEHKRPAVVHALSIFAQAKPQLFTIAQLQPLLPYLKNVKATDNSNLYRYTIIIMRHTLPYMSNLPNALVEDMQSTLLQTLSRLPAAELKEVIICLWTLTSILGNSGKLVTITRSALDKFKSIMTSDSELTQIASVKTVLKLVLLIGHFAATFELDEHIAQFREKFPAYKGDSLPVLALEQITPLTLSNRPLAIRESALDSVCRICNAHPRLYMRPDVCGALQMAFQCPDDRLPLVLMDSLRGFFGPVADKKTVKTESSSQSAIQAGNDRIVKTYVATDRDGASTSLAQTFLTDAIDIALKSTGKLALSSAQVVVAINQLGLVHPRESAPCLVALQTSSTREIANMAYEEYKALFTRHESMYEKESVRAVQQAFAYQMRHANDSRGHVGSPAIAKLALFWDVMTIASAKTRKRFVTALCTRLEFTPSKLEYDGTVPSHFYFSRFCLENLALFDYTKADDLLALVDGLERIVSATGTGIAHEIESVVGNNGQTQSGIENQNSQLGSDTPQDANHEPPVNGNNTSTPDNLRRLGASAAILTLMWETRTYVSRLWSLSKYTSAQKRATSEKSRELARAPQRIPNSQPMTERYLARMSEIAQCFATPEALIQICTEFGEIMSVDEEARAVDDGDGDIETATPVNGDESAIVDARMPFKDSLATPEKRGRKRKSMTPGDTPRKKRNLSKSRTSAAVKAKKRMSKARRSADVSDDEADEDFGA